MPVKESTFKLAGLAQNLASSGLRSGDTVLVQLSLSAFGITEDLREQRGRIILSAILDVIGNTGTLLAPAFTFSFDRQEEFDPAASMPVVGPWSDAVEFTEAVLQHDGAVRSNDPLYSVVGIGPGASGLLSNLPNSSVGPSSLIDRLSRVSAKLCLIGVPLKHAIAVDFAEVEAAVPWRYKKLFTGKVRADGMSRRQGWIASVVNPCLKNQADTIRNRVTGRAEAEFHGAQDSPVATADVRSLVELLQADFAREAAAFDWSQVSKDLPLISVQLPDSATMSETISALWRLPRDIVSDGYDAALRALATQVPMQVHEYPTGTECWTWLVPEKWSCREARLETSKGDVLFSYRDNPLHAVSYSLPFEGTVTRDELFRHLHTHPRLDDAIPFIFKYYERDWGLCCSKNLKESLNDVSYRVVIDSDFSFGSLKVGECIAQGKSDKTFVLCAHLC